MSERRSGHWLGFFLYAISALGTLRPAYAHDTVTGQIAGRAVDARGKPVPRLPVSAHLVSGRPRAMPLRETITDNDGRFLIDHLEFGPYSLHSVGEDDGYPNTYFSFYTGGVPPPRVVLTPQSPSGKVQLVVGPKAARIVGTVTDAVTGAPLSANFRLWRTGNPDDWVGIGARPQFDILIPADTDVSFYVHAEGYQDWYYPDGGASSGRSFRLKSEERMTVDVLLQPINK